MMEKFGEVNENLQEDSYLYIFLSKIDSLILTFVFLLLLSQARSYGEPGLFPVVFLIAGIFALVIDILLPFLPSSVGQHTAQIISKDIDEVSDEEKELDILNEESISVVPVTIVIIMLFIYFFVAYFVNFLIATPIFVISTGYLIGVSKYQLLLLTILLTGTVYILFGVLMNTPILQ